ncbi:MAG: leucine-rich repeat domain-containing protein, partial [Prevotella sp.]|nr:leucine-rich repeat domain-containing protein [Prevotella sp.]
MKTNMKQTLLTFALMLLPMLASAAVEKNGIYYNLNDGTGTAEVTQHPNKYRGAISIPDKVVIDGTEYSVTSIGIEAFSYCSGLTSITIPNSVMSIGNYAFYFCLGLTSVTIPSSVTSIGKCAFSNCMRLTSIAIPNSVASIGSSAFAGCKRLTSVTMPSSVTSIGENMFYDCTSLTSLTIPNSVTTIGPMAFVGCGLKSLVIPNSVATIGNSAFEGCRNVASITIGRSVKSIGNHAFYHTSALNDVYCLPKDVPAVLNYEGKAGGTEAFGDSYKMYVTLHVPSAALVAYSTTEPWSEAKSIVAFTEEDIKCAMPTIAYVDGRLVFSCETPGAECVYEIKCTDSGSGRGGEVNLSQTYEIRVYATLEGWYDSDVAVATIGWRNGRPAMEGFSSVTLDDDGSCDVNSD